MTVSQGKPAEGLAVLSRSGDRAGQTAWGEDGSEAHACPEADGGRRAAKLSEGVELEKPFQRI